MLMKMEVKEWMVNDSASFTDETANLVSALAQPLSHCH